MTYEKYFEWDANLLKCNKGSHKVNINGVIAKIGLTAAEIFVAGYKYCYSDLDCIFDICFQ